MKFHLRASLAIAVLFALTSATWAQEDTTKLAPGENPVPQLLKNLESDNVTIAAAAARSLGVVFAPGGKGGPEVGEATEALIAKLDSPKGADLRREAATALGRMRAQKAPEPLKKAIADEDVQVAVAAAEAVAAILPTDEARSFLKERGQDESENVKAAVFAALAKIAKPEDADYLAAGLELENWRIQKGAVEGLERAVRSGAQLDPETYDHVAAVLGNEIVNAANASVHFLTHIRNEESLRATIKATRIRGDGSETDGTWRARAMALRTLYHLGWPTCQQALPAIIDNLGDRTANVTNEARRILNWGRKEHYVSQQDLFPILLIQLEKAEPLRLRGGIMREMGNHVDRQYASRVAAVSAKTLEAAMEANEEWTARQHALILLGASGHTGNIETIAQCVHDNVGNVRNAAGTALQELAPLCDAERLAMVPPVLQPLLEKPVDWRKTAIAARAMGYYPSSEAVEPLARLLSHSVINVKDGAADALSQYAASQDETLRESVKKATFAELGSTRGAWEYGSKVLGALKDAEAVPLLITVLRGGDWRTQSNASTAVAQIAEDNKIADKELSDTLIKVAQSEVLQVQDAANQALRVLAKDK